MRSHYLWILAVATAAWAVPVAGPSAAEDARQSDKALQSSGEIRVLESTPADTTDEETADTTSPKQKVEVPTPAKREPGAKRAPADPAASEPLPTPTTKPTTEQPKPEGGMVVRQLSPNHKPLSLSAASAACCHVTDMMQVAAIRLMALIVGLTGTVTPAPGSELLAWPEITKECRPGTYWWWMGSAVNPVDLTRELERYRAAGMGGVHIIPIYGAKG